MRFLAALVVVGGLVFGAFSHADDNNPDEAGLPFELVAHRPDVVLHQMPLITDAEYLTVTGVVFSRTPIDRVELRERKATLRPAESDDLVRIERVPTGVSDAAYRTYFEVTDAALTEPGANIVGLRACTIDGRCSDVHRITIIRTTEPPAAP